MFFGVLFAAIASHVLADWITVAGVPLLFPLSKKRYGLGLCRSDNPWVNNLFLVGAVLMVIYWIGKALF
jgi:inner membrane protein